MTKLYFRYGNGKSADLCMVNYNYRENNGKTIVIDAAGRDTIISNAETNGKKILELSTNDFISDDFFYKGFDYKKNGISAILVDNAEYLTREQVNNLYYISKVFDIAVICYGDRRIVTKGILRLFELANSIEQIDGYNHFNDNATMEFFYGTMNCSKTAKLLYKSRELELMGRNVVVVKPALDRDTYKIKSRIGLERKADIVVFDDTNIFEKVLSIPYEIDYLLVDEGQFLSEKNIRDLLEVTKRLNIPCRVYGLKSDFQTNLFKGSKELLSLSDQITKLKTVCSCDNNPGAEFNARKFKNGSYVFEGDQCVVDDGTIYEYIPLCAECYFKKVFEADISSPKQFIKKMNGTKF